MYVILTIAVFTLSQLLYEVLRRIPVVRWCVFGQKKTKARRGVLLALVLFLLMNVLALG